MADPARGPQGCERLLLRTDWLADGPAAAKDRFSKLVVNGETEAKEWTSIRMTKNYQDDHGVTDVSGADIRCFQMKAGSGVATVAAGATLGFVADQTVTHPGPVQLYMARVPDDRDINNYEAVGDVWFKVGSIGATTGGKALTWSTYRTCRALCPLFCPRQCVLTRCTCGA